MTFKSRTIIEITESSIKVFQASLTANIPLTYGGMIDSRNLSDNEISQKLGDIRKAKRFSLQNSQIILIIPRQYVILRYLDLPSENMDELRAMVELQVGNHIPYSREDVVVDFMPLQKNAEGYTKVMVVAVPLETVMRFERILEMAHLTPHKITTSFVGQWQWYHHRFPSQTGVTVILDVDSERSEICFCDQNKVLISRPTMLGVRDIDAKRYEDFFKQLDWTMASYVKEQLGPPIEQILLLSTLSSVEELKEQMQKYYTITVQDVRTLQDLPLRKTFAWPPLLLKEWPSITAVLGLLQVQHPLLIDLIPPVVKASQASQANKKQGVRSGLVTVIALASLTFCFSLNFFKQNTRLSYLENTIKEAQKQVSQIKQKKRELNTLKSMVENRIIMADVINEIYQSISPGTVLTSLSLTREHSLSLQGYTTKVGEVNDMQRALVGSVFFDTVNLDYVNKRVTLDGELDYFKMTCHIKVKDQSDEETQ
jgi:Tfp pilus assembly PilM family ATPase/Tfp pilus assembly protein PilN